MSTRLEREAFRARNERIIAQLGMEEFHRIAALPPATRLQDSAWLAAVEVVDTRETPVVTAARALIQSWDRDDLSLNPEDWHEALDNLRKAVK